MTTTAVHSRGRLLAPGARDVCSRQKAKSSITTSAVMNHPSICAVLGQRCSCQYHVRAATKLRRINSPNSPSTYEATDSPVIVTTSNQPSSAPCPAGVDHSDAIFLVMPPPIWLSGHAPQPGADEKDRSRFAAAGDES